MHPSAQPPLLFSHSLTRLCTVVTVGLVTTWLLAGGGVVMAGTGLVGLASAWREVQFSYIELEWLERLHISSSCTKIAIDYCGIPCDQK